MDKKIISFSGREERKKEIADKVMASVPEDMWEDYSSNSPFRIMVKFDSLNEENQSQMFEYLMLRAKKEGRLRKSHFVIELLRAIGGQEAWDEVESIADKYLLKEACEHGEIRGFVR